MKPWAKCASDDERLDVFNGLLLSANLDAAFDAGLVTFDDAGLMYAPRRCRPTRARGSGGAARCACGASRPRTARTWRFTARTSSSGASHEVPVLRGVLTPALVARHAERVRNGRRRGAFSAGTVHRTCERVYMKSKR